jgi:hypothetical protein
VLNGSNPYFVSICVISFANLAKHQVFGRAQIRTDLIEDFMGFLRRKEARKFGLLREFAIRGHRVFVVLCLVLETSLRDRWV